MISPEQCRGARGLLKWSQTNLAATSGVSDTTVRNFENGIKATLPETNSALQQALEAAGIKFIWANGGGPGARLREALSKE